MTTSTIYSNRFTWAIRLEIWRKIASCDRTLRLDAQPITRTCTYQIYLNDLDMSDFSRFYIIWQIKNSKYLGFKIVSISYISLRSALYLQEKNIVKNWPCHPSLFKCVLYLSFVHPWHFSHKQWFVLKVIMYFNCFEDFVLIL